MKRKQNKGFTLAELLIVVAIIGVLVAISIPIFTSQLRKARVAVNQAYLEDPSYDIIAYDIRSGKVAKSKSTGANIKIDLNINGTYNPEYNIVPTDISSWNVNTPLAKNEAYKFGDYYFYRYIYTFDKDGSITKIQANDNYKSTNVTDPY